IPKIATLFYTLQIDHLGPLPCIHSKKKYVLVVSDALTKFVKLYPTASKNAQEVGNTLFQYMAYYSRPSRVISDRATCFTSAQFKDFLNVRVISYVLKATNSPQANGQVERVNRVLRPILSKLSSNIDHANWSLQLTKAEYALNNTFHSSTKFTPSVMLFGVEQRGHMVDELTEFVETKNDIPSKDFDSIRLKASENIVKSQETNEKQFLKKNNPANTGTSPNTNKKLIAKYRGPYAIYKFLPNDRYVVRKIDGYQVTQMPYDGVLESDKLRLWVQPNAFQHIENSPSNTSSPNLGGGRPTGLLLVEKREVSECVIRGTDE
uniref:Integrase catalytic domain-containing protein n=1 Tax=Anopheles funestus TaxID=62324 RepID=A0A182RZY8_ANOFN